MSFPPAAGTPQLADVTLTTATLQAHDAWMDTQPPPKHKCASSASSMSSEMNEANEVQKVDNTSLWRPKLPGRWAETRLVQIQECLKTFHDGLFLSYDEMHRAEVWAERMLAYVLRNMKQFETREMANSAYWAIHLCQIAFSLKEHGFGYEIRSKDQEELDRAVECWSMTNMHKVLLGDKSKSFKDPTKQGSLTQVSSQAARKIGIPGYLLAGDARRRAMDVRALGNESQQIKKSACFFEIWRLAGLDEVGSVDSKIVARQPPCTHRYNKSGSARERKAAETLRDKGTMVAMKVTNKKAHALQRRGMLGAGVKSVVPHNLFKKLGSSTKGRGLSTGSTDRYQNPSQFSDPSESESECAEGVPVARKKKGISRNGAVEAVQEDKKDEDSRPVERATVPSDDEADADEEKEAFLKEFLLPVAPMAPVVVEPMDMESSDDDEDYDEGMGEESEDDGDDDDDDDGDDDDGGGDDGDEQEPAGPREEGCVTLTPADFREKTDALKGVSMSDRDQDKLKRVVVARGKMRLNERLTAGDCKILNWFKNLDVESIKQGKLVTKRSAPSLEQIVKRKQKEAARNKSHMRRELVKTQRRELNAAILEERNERKLAVLERHRDEADAKLKRAEGRAHRRIERANEKINDFRKGKIAKNRKKKERMLERADRKMQIAKKRNLDVVIPTGDLKFKILLRQRPEEAPLQDGELIASSYADVYKVEMRVAKRLKNGAAVPMPVAAGAPDALRIRMAQRPGQRSGTRASAAIEDKKKALAEAEVQLKAAAETAAASAAAVTEAQANSAAAGERWVGAG